MEQVITLIVSGLIESRNARLFDDLDGAGGTLDFACSANEALVIVYNDRFSISDLEDVYGTYVNACSVSIAFFNINFNFYHGTLNSTF